MRKLYFSGPLIVSALTLLFGCSGIGWAQQASVGSVVPITSLGTRTPIPLPALTPEGGPLIFSDAPEVINDTFDLPGATTVCFTTFASWLKIALLPTPLHSLC